MRNLNLRLLVWCGILLGLLLYDRAFAVSASINPSADAFVTTGSGGSLTAYNYGGAGALSVAAPGLSGGEFQSVLQFGLSGVKSSFDSQFGVGAWSLQSVTLRLTAAFPNNAMFNSPAAGQFRVAWMQNDGWIEGTGTPQTTSIAGISFSTLSNFVSGSDQVLGTFSYNGATSGNASYSLSPAGSFAADIMAGNIVSLRMYAVGSSLSYVANSRNFSTGSQWPLLTVSAIAVPEPGVAALGGMGLLLFVSSRRFRRQ